MTAALARFLAGLNRRERLLVLVLVLIALPAGAVFGVVQPMLERRAAAEQSVAEALALRDWLGARQAEVAALPSPAEASTDVPVAPVGLSAIEEQLVATGLRRHAVELLNPEGATITLRFADAPYTDLMPWLESVERQSGYRITSLRLARSERADLVGADVQLEPGQ